MRTLLSFALGAVLMTAFGGRADAQPAPFDLASLDTYFNSAPKVEVNLRGSLLRLASAASREDEPEVADLIENLRGITVRVYPLASARAGLVDRLVSFESSLQSQGWSTLVRVRPDPAEGDTDDVWIYVRDEGDMFGGLAVMALDHEQGEAAFVFIDGLIDPLQVGRLTSQFGGVDYSADDDDDDRDDNRDDN